VNASFLIADPTAICRQKLQKKGIGVVPTQARATAFQLRWDERLLMKVTSERIRNIIPTAIARLVIHVQTSSASFSTSSRSSGVMSTGLMFFSTSFGLTFFSLLGLLPVHSQNTPIVDLKCPLSTFARFSLANLQQVLPLPQITLEAQALGDLTRRDDTSLDLFARLASSFTGPPILSPGLIKVRNKSVALDGSRRLYQARSESVVVGIFDNART
jgi:hypothetical protein